MIFQIINNNVPKKDFKMYMVESDHFLFTDNSTRDNIGDGIILLKIFPDNIKLSTIINVQYLEVKLASATLWKYENNVLSCTREMEKLYKEIIRLNPGTYNNNRFLTELFRSSETTTNDSFERAVEVVKAKWNFGWRNMHGRVCNKNMQHKIPKFGGL